RIFLSVGKASSAKAMSWSASRVRSNCIGEADPHEIKRRKNIRFNLRGLLFCERSRRSIPMPNQSDSNVIAGVSQQDFNGDSQRFAAFLVYKSKIPHLDAELTAKCTSCITYCETSAKYGPVKSQVCSGAPRP